MTPDKGSLQYDYCERNMTTISVMIHIPVWALLSLLYILYPGISIKSKSKKTTDHISINEMGLKQKPQNDVVISNLRA